MSVLTLNYGNWIRKKNLAILSILTLISFLLLFLPWGIAFRVFSLILFCVLLISFSTPLYAYFMFSHSGGEFQEKIYAVLIGHFVDQNLSGKVLDIGSGNGILSIELAQAIPGIEVSRIDYWGKDWEYSIAVCEDNARKTNLEKRIHFQKGDAAKLEFEESTFDGVASNLTFHEVQSVKDKKDVLKEALRVLKPGGCYLCGLFLRQPILRKSFLFGRMPCGTAPRLFSNKTVTTGHEYPLAIKAPQHVREGWSREKRCQLSR